jgi:cyanophycinase
MWQGTPLQTVIKERSERVPMGGTSAGCAIMGEFVYDASAGGSATTEMALIDPYHAYITFSQSFVEVPYLHSLVTDTHFQERDRMGRMVAFMGRLLQDGMTSEAGVVRSAGFNEQNAMLVDRNGNGRVVGVGDTFMCSTTEVPNQFKVQAQTNLTFAPVNCEKLEAGDTFSFDSFAGTGEKYSFQIVNGVISGNQYNS